MFLAACPGVVMSKIISPQVLVITSNTIRQMILTKKPGKICEIRKEIEITKSYIVF